MTWYLIVCLSKGKVDTEPIENQGDRADKTNTYVKQV